MYDYIIVGAGSAGCVLANRLSADPDVTVLLLEAGEPDSLRELGIPAAAPTLFETSLDWSYQTEPQEYLNNDRLKWPRGKVLGGSSSINLMIYVRGNRLDYDGWEASGAHGWGFSGVTPYFKRSEHQERGESDLHGTGGPLDVADLRSVNPLSSAFVDAAVEAGFPRNADFNGPVQDGAGFYQVTQRNGKRASASTAFLAPVRSRPNLTVRTNCHVTRVVIEDAVATGVEWAHDGQRDTERAGREVILSGGTINSPQLLMLSGVGPADHLRDLHLPVAVDLPGVGQNLHDHLLVPVIYESTQPVSMASAGSIRDLASYFLLGKGPLSSNIAEAGGFARSKADLASPDLQFNCAPVYFMTRGHEMPEGHGFSLSTQILNPASRGAIRLRSSDPFAPPVIQPNYLADESDLELFVEGVRRARDISQAGPFDEFRGAEVWPGPERTSDDELKAFIRATAEGAMHPVGTCRMGIDDEAVVDPSLRVRGIQGLRVVDASIMPVITRGNTNAPAMMIAEKGADLIRFSA